MPFLAPISTAILASTMRSSSDSRASAGPANSRAWYWRAIRAQLRGQRQRDILGEDARRQRTLGGAGQSHANRRRRFQPDFAAHENGRQVGGADSGGEAVDGPVSHRVAVRSHHQAARRGAARLHHELVADALAHFPQQDAVARGEGPHALMQLRGGAAGRGSVVIERQRHAAGVVYPHASHSLEIIQRHGRRAIRAQGPIHGANHHVPGPRVTPGFGAENFLADGLARQVSAYQSRIGSRGESGAGGRARGAARPVPLEPAGGRG